MIIFKEVLVLATEDDCSSRSKARIERILTERAIHAYRGMTRFSTEGLEDVGAVIWEKPFQDQDLVASLPKGSLWLLRMNYRKKIT